MNEDEEQIEVQIYFGPDRNGEIVMIGAECCESTSCHDIWPVTAKIPMTKVLAARPPNGSKKYFTHVTSWIETKEEEV